MKHYALSVIPMWLMASVLAGGGCAKKAPEAQTPAVAKTDRWYAAPVAQAPAPGAAAEAGQAKVAAPPAAADKTAPRKIKYTAEVRLIADDFAKSENDLKQLVKDHKGYIAQSEVGGSVAAGRHGLWKVRVPAEAFDTFREAVLKIAEVETNKSDSEDLTEEYHDLENHIKNRLVEEESLRKLMEKAANKMDEYLSLRRELSTIRDEINRKQGRLNLLGNLTDLATLTVTMVEKQKYLAAKGPELMETPTFGERVGKTFADSFGLLTDFSQGVALLGVAAGPWLPLAILIGLPSWLLWRRHARDVAVQKSAAP